MRDDTVLYGYDMDYQRTMEQYGRSPEALARFMTEEAFGIYGKDKLSSKINVLSL